MAPAKKRGSTKAPPALTYQQRYSAIFDAVEGVMSKENLTFEDLPLNDMVESDKVRLAFEKMIGAMADGVKGAPKTPEEALELLQDRDAFAGLYYDPYVDEFNEELGYD